MRTILVADDNPVSRELLREILNSAEYRIIEAADGREALDLVYRMTPDLLVLDLQMPHLDGMSVARLLRREPRYSNLPMVALTALAMNEDRELALAAGFDAFISKPVRPAALREQVDRLLAQLQDARRGASKQAANKEANEQDS